MKEVFICKLIYGFDFRRVFASCTPDDNVEFVVETILVFDVLDRTKLMLNQKNNVLRY